MPPSKQALINQQKQAWDEINKQRASLDVATALLLRVTMLELAEADPRIVEFEFDANFEYDDEGGYFWSESYFALDAEGERIGEDDDPLGDVFEVLRDCGADENSILAAFNTTDRLEGRITVAELRTNGLVLRA